VNRNAIGMFAAKLADEAFLAANRASVLKLYRDLLREGSKRIERTGVFERRKKV